MSDQLCLSAGKYYSRSVIRISAKCHLGATLTHTGMNRSYHTIAGPKLSELMEVTALLEYLVNKCMFY